MSKLTKTKKKSLIDRMKKLDGLSWFFLISTIIIILGFLVVLIALLPKPDVTAEEDGYPYYVESLNFTVNFPEGWVGAKPDEETTKRVLYETTGGVLFDMLNYSLPEEVVPITLLTEPNKEDAKKDSKYISLAFRGSDKKYAYLENKVNIMDDFKSLLSSMEHKNIVVDSVEDYNKHGLDGVLLSGSAEFEGVKTYYYQYFEPAGANLLTATFGATSKKARNIEELAYVINSIIYHEGGYWYPDEIKEEIKEEYKSQLEEEGIPLEKPEEDTEEHSHEESEDEHDHEESEDEHDHNH